MNKRVYYGIFAAVIVIVLAVLIKLYGPTNVDHTITVPSPVESSGANSSDDSINRIEITPENVQVALKKTLARSTSYSRTYTIKSFFDGGQSSSTLEVWQNSDKIKMVLSQNKTVENILIIGNDLYIWYKGLSGVKHLSLSEGSLNKEVDMFSRLVTYEDIYDVDPKDITDAGYRVLFDEPCIYAEYISGEYGYVNQIYVSLDSGLLVASYIYDGDTPTYSMESTVPELTTPADDVFAVPST